MSVRNYINNAREAASKNYMDWTGNSSNNGARNWTGETKGNARRQNSTFSADGGTNAVAPVSQPYIITISNVSATAVSNFDILGAYTYINNAGFSAAGSLTILGVTISSAIANVNYRQFLYQSMTQPFSVGLTYIQSIVNVAQITQTFTLTTQDANGNQLSRVIVPVLSPFQNQSGIVSVSQVYSIDGFTKITYNQILASAVFQMQFYPSTNINLAAGLVNGQVTQQASSPNINQLAGFIV